MTSERNRRPDMMQNRRLPSARRFSKGQDVINNSANVNRGGANNNKNSNASALQFDDLDYCSDIFVAQANNNSSSKSTTSKQQKPLSALMEQSYSQGISQPIAEDNKGFKMLRKLGYIAGSGLGKSEHGITEPISIQKRSSDTISVGLGVLEAKRRKIEDFKASKDKQQENFKYKLSADYTSGKLKKDLESIIKTLYELDIKHGKCFSHKCSQAWSDRIEGLLEENSDNKDDHAKGTLLTDDIGLTEEIGSLVHHLRNVYNYCYYCGVEYDNEDDLLNNCPGSEEEDHS